MLKLEVVVEEEPLNIFQLHTKIRQITEILSIDGEASYSKIVSLSFEKYLSLPDSQRFRQMLCAATQCTKLVV